MADNEQKKTIIIELLDVLKKHSDAGNTLSQNRIKELLRTEFGREIDRKTVRRNLSKLMEYGFPIRYLGSEEESEAITRIGRNGQRSTILTGWYYDHEFTNGELQLLIDNVLFADGLSKRYRIELIKRLEKLSGISFRSVMKKIDMDIYGRLENGQIFFTLENIGTAIAQGKQITFRYCDCGMDGKLHYRLDGSRKKKSYTVSPYQLVSRNGHTYLIGHTPEHDGLTHFRIDRIKDSEVMDIPSKQLRTVKGFESGIRLSEYVSTHPDLWSGPVILVTFRCRQCMMNDVADNFGTDLRIEELPDDMMKVYVYASEASMLHWAVQFADVVEVLSPESLRGQIRDTLKNALSRYES